MSLLIKLVKLFRDAHRRSKLHHSPSPKAVTSEVVEPDRNDRDIHSVLVQSTERDHRHSSLPERGQGEIEKRGRSSGVSFGGLLRPARILQ